MFADHFVFAGGGHTHALILQRWVMNPHLKPNCLITLINRRSTTFYSGMIPGVISGKYSLDEALIDLRRISDIAGISFVEAEITGIDLKRKKLELNGRSPISYTKLSLDIGCETAINKKKLKVKNTEIALPIKPFHNALQLVKSEDKEAFSCDAKPFSVVGSGLSGLEVVFALRKRWPIRLLNLYAYSSQLSKEVVSSLNRANIQLKSSDELIPSFALLCTGSKGPDWIEESGLCIDASGRILTNDSFQALDYSNVFAVGDCAVFENNYRPPSGVWAVRAAKPLAKNIENSFLDLPMTSWSPQRNALQLVGACTKLGDSVAWAFWGRYKLGPYRILSVWKEFIDRRFMTKFDRGVIMQHKSSPTKNSIPCRGCASKLGEQSLKGALKKAGLITFTSQSEDAHFIGSLDSGDRLLQSVDGFPALITDPWLNGRLTLLHASSDIWACGASVVSAQVVVTLPAIPSPLQQELLVQSLDGINSALIMQGAKLLGGHTLESREAPPSAVTLGIDISLCVNGTIDDTLETWSKEGLQRGDCLLISGPLGVGVLFAASMIGKASSSDMEAVISHMANSQYECMESLIMSERQKSKNDQNVHCCTDITGFGLLGHLGEMLEMSNLANSRKGLEPLRIKIYGEKIPSFHGALDLFFKGFASSLAPSNRYSFRFLESNLGMPPQFFLELDSLRRGSAQHKAILELMIDPQTCGPLVIACPPNFSEDLISRGPWTLIGEVI